MIKKIIGIVCLIPSFVLAGEQTAETRNGFYIKADVGISKMKNAKQHNVYPEDDINVPTNKSKPKMSFPVSIAAGFYLNDYVRHDLSFGYQKVNFKKSVVDCVWYDRAGNILDEQGKFTVNRKATIYSLMFNSYVDMPINDQFQVFAGAGLGIARINEKGNLSVTQLNKTKVGDKVKSKKKQNFAYSLTTGISYKLNDNTNLELSYKWSDYGKTKYKDKDVTKNRYRGHSILTGIRYSM